MQAVQNYNESVPKNNKAELTPEQLCFQRLRGIISVLGKPQFHIQQILIDPLLAQTILDNTNDTNRPIDIYRVNKYRDEMKNGTFYSLAEDIIFDKNGNLIQGQHRLKALIAANVSLSFNVKTNVPPEVSEYLDQGKPRSAGDVITIRNGGNQVSNQVKKIADINQLFKGFASCKVALLTNNNVANFILEPANSSLMDKIINTLKGSVFDNAIIRAAFLNFILKNPSREKEILGYAKLLNEDISILNSSAYRNHPLRKLSKWWEDMDKQSRKNRHFKVSGREKYAHILSALDLLIIQNKKTVRSLSPLSVDPYTGSTFKL